MNNFVPGITKDDASLSCINCGKTGVTTVDKDDYVYHVCHACRYAWASGSKEGFKKHGQGWKFVPEGRLWVTDEKPEW